MIDESDLITCDTHGQKPPAYICNHLYEHPSQEWFSELPGKVNLCPDAWCVACESVFQKSGGWTDESQGKPRITMVCENCYELLRGKSVAFCTELVQTEWQEFAQSCLTKLSEKQAVLQQQYQINDHSRWDWDLDSQTLVFSNDGVAAVSAKIELVGSFSSTSSTWLWVWGNKFMTNLNDTLSDKLIEYGGENKFVKLSTPFWPADEYDGWEMTAIAVELLGCKGGYRTPSDTGHTYMLIHDIDWVS